MDQIKNDDGDQEDEVRNLNIILSTVTAEREALKRKPLVNPPYGPEPPFLEVVRAYEKNSVKAGKKYSKISEQIIANETEHTEKQNKLKELADYIKELESDIALVWAKFHKNVKDKLIAKFVEEV